MFSSSRPMVFLALLCTAFPLAAFDELAYYTALHQQPELSFQEEQTAATLARTLREGGFSVTEGVGGHGVVALLDNGAGPRLLLRADMDGLPVVEQTGLPYASTARATEMDGSEVGVMHACGHDVHMTVVVGAALELAARRDDWRGSLMVIMQPAEERGAGARMMLDDGLFERFRIDVVEQDLNPRLSTDLGNTTPHET